MFTFFHYETNFSIRLRHHASVNDICADGHPFLTL